MQPLSFYQSCCLKRPEFSGQSRQRVLMISFHRYIKIAMLIYKSADCYFKEKWHIQTNATFIFLSKLLSEEAELSG